MKTDKFIILILVIILLFIFLIFREYLINKIIKFLFKTHLFLNKRLKYDYRNDNKNVSGYWEGDQIKKNRTSNDLKKYLLKYYVRKNIKSVLDLGCGNCEYVKFLNKNGIKAIGIENRDHESIYIKKLDLIRPYYNPKDYVQTFEVGEHIPKRYENIFIDNICKNARKGIIMSWAVPGQGGDGHVNEKKNK